MSCQHAHAVNELLKNIGADDCIEVLDEFWESWITNESTDGATATMRAEKLIAYKDLRRFFKSISTEQC